MRWKYNNDQKFRPRKEEAMGCYKAFHGQLEENHLAPVTYAVY